MTELETLRSLNETVWAALDILRSISPRDLPLPIYEPLRTARTKLSRVVALSTARVHSLEVAAREKSSTLTVRQDTSPKPADQPQ